MRSKFRAETEMSVWGCVGFNWGLHSTVLFVLDYFLFFFKSLCIAILFLSPLSFLGKSSSHMKYALASI